MTALISTIASTTTEPSKSALESAAENACASLVKHYSDPIHHAADENEIPPHFHYGCSTLPKLPPVCEFWYHNMVEVDRSEDKCSGDETEVITSLDITRELLYCYETIIHPVMINSSTSMKSAMKVIEQYELFLAHFVTNGAADDSTRNTSCGYVDGVAKRLDRVRIYNDNNYDDENELHRIGRIVYCIAQDISYWISKTIHDNDQSVSEKKLFPYLLRLLGYCITMLSSSPTMMDLNSTTDLTALEEMLSIATVICVPFVGDGKSKSGNFGIGTLLDWTLGSNCCANDPFSIAAALKCCSPSPYEVMDDSTLVPSSVFMSRPVIDWSAQSGQFIAHWSSDVSFNVASQVLQQVESASHIFLSSQEDTYQENCHSTIDILLLLQSISLNVGVDVLTSTVRAFFYARLSFPSSSPSDVSKVSAKPLGPYMPMIRRIGSDKKEVENQNANDTDLTKEHDKFRVSAATLILCAVLSQHSSFKVCDDALLHAMPIALTLLDKVQAFQQSLGATIFTAAIESLSPFESDVRNPSFVAKFNQFLTPALETAINHCGREDAPLITALCFAQSKWIQYLSVKSDQDVNNCVVSREAVNAMTRKATSDMMKRVINQTQFGGNNGNDERIAGILVAGVNPLLALLAKLPDAASIEVARVGLSALLPLIAWRGSGLESHAIHISSMACLLSLMDGAYPVMNKHGGTILTELILLLDRNDKDSKYLSETNSSFEAGSDNHTASSVTVNIAIYCGAVGLIVCGESAEAVIQHVKSSNFQQPFNRCTEIKNLSNKIRP